MGDRTDDRDIRDDGADDTRNGEAGRPGPLERIQAALDRAMRCDGEMTVLYGVNPARRNAADPFAATPVIIGGDDERADGDDDTDGDKDSEDDDKER